MIQGVEVFLLGTRHNEALCSLFNTMVAEVLTMQGTRGHVLTQLPLEHSSFSSRRVNSLRVNHHWFKYWFVAWLAPSHYLNQCWNIVNGTLRNKLQWNLKQNSYIFIHENAFENVIYEMGAISSRPQCVNVFSVLVMDTYASVKWVITGSGNGLLPVQCQAITWTNADLLSFGPLERNFSEIWLKICNFSIMKMHLKMPSAKWPFWPGGDELMD